MYVWEVYFLFFFYFFLVGYGGFSQPSLSVASTSRGMIVASVNVSPLEYQKEGFTENHVALYVYISIPPTHKYKRPLTNYKWMTGIFSHLSLYTIPCFSPLTPIELYIFSFFLFIYFFSSKNIHSLSHSLASMVYIRLHTLAQFFG